jgi:RNA polymerase sigma-70 factor (ECF subfamily)
LRKLIDRARKGDGEAFAELMSSVKRDMYRVAKGCLRNDDDAADAISSAVLSCFEHLPELREPRYFKTWLIRILINECGKISAQNNRRVALSEITELPCEDAERGKLEFSMLMDTLDEQYRLVMILRYAEEMSIKEIAAATDLSVDAVKQRLKRGRDKARQIYETPNGEAII